MKLLEYLAIAVIGLVVVQGNTNDSGIHKKKSFSLFSLVQFPNSECTTVSNKVIGICKSSSECEAAGGFQDGSCASGFGVCCLQRQSSCGSQISENVTYIVNPGFPNTYTTTDTGKVTCQYTISSNADICQLRLDFSTFMIADVDSTGQCNTDNLEITGVTGVSPPVVCGVLTGSHMYIETGRMDASTMVTFSLDLTTSATRNYQIRVSQVPCSSPFKAPTDCTQYFTADSGTFWSYNFNSGKGHFMQGQSFSTCFRQNDGFCKIQFTPKVEDGVDSFYIQKANTAATTSINIQCVLANIQINDGVGSTTYCGAYLNQLNSQTSQSALQLKSTVFDVRTFSCYTVPVAIGNLYANTCNQYDSTGYEIEYKQLPC